MPVRQALCRAHGYADCRAVHMNDAPDSKPRKHAAAGRGRTQSRRSNQGEASGPQPRLPNERDESSDSQVLADASAADIGSQALRDLQRGLEDTSLGPVTDRTYHRIAEEQAGSGAPPRRTRRKA